MNGLMRLGLNKAATSQLMSKRSVQSLRLGGLISKRMFSKSSARFSDITTKAEQDLLVAQRGKRPVSPHLTIYQPQLTWYLSSCHRLSAVVLGFAFYALTIAFGISSVLGLGLTTDKLSKWYHEKFSPMTQSMFKGVLSYLFALQLTLTVRHFMWDMGKQLTLKGVYSTGYAAMAVTAVLGTWLWW